MSDEKRYGTIAKEISKIKDFKELYLYAGMVTRVLFDLEEKNGRTYTNKEIRKIIGSYKKEITEQHKKYKQGEMPR